jgi:hypothetical protein
VFSPARLLVRGYRQVAARDPAKFTPLTLFIQRMMPPLLYWIWLHSTYVACMFLMLGLLGISIRFWLSGLVCLVAYLVLLWAEFRRSQEQFRTRLWEHRAPQDECLYVHLIFAHDTYVSFLSFRRLFVAAAPAFSAPSSSSSAATALIPPSLPPAALLWPSSRPVVPQRYPVSHLQHVLPVAPLFFGNVYVDFICYLLLPPRMFASSRVRSATHFLLPVLYLGQAMVAAVRALSPLALQGCVLLAPFVHVELLWFLHVLDSIPNPLSFLPWFAPWFTPLLWARRVVGTWLLHLAAVAWSSWERVTGVLFTISAPMRWVNSMLSPLLEFIRQEARALWGITVLAQPVVALLMRLREALWRVWTAVSTVGTILASTLGSVLPSRLFALFGAVKSSAETTAAVGSGLSAAASGTAGSHWRVLWQSVLEWSQLISKLKAVIDRVRLNIQLVYYERVLHVRDARNLAGHSNNPTLDVPVVTADALARTRSELSGADADADVDALSLDPDAAGEQVNEDLLLTPRRPLTPDVPRSSSDGAARRRATPLHKSSSRRASVSNAHLPSSLTAALSAGGSGFTSASCSPVLSVAATDLPSPPTFTLSPLQAEPPVFAPGVIGTVAAVSPPRPPPINNVVLASPPPPAVIPSSSVSAPSAVVANSSSSSLQFSGFDDGYEHLVHQSPSPHLFATSSVLGAVPAPLSLSAPPSRAHSSDEDADTVTEAASPTSGADEVSLTHRDKMRRLHSGERKERTP